MAFIQGGHNLPIVRIEQIFFNPKIVRIVRIFFSNCTDRTDFYPGKYTVFLNFHSFQQIFHKNFKNSCQNEVSLIYFLHSK